VTSEKYTPTAHSLLGIDAGHHATRHVGRQRGTTGMDLAALG
jgi:hypothetical protein